MDNILRTKRLKDFPNYIVYSDGRVFSIKNNKFLKSGRTGKNKEYLTVGLWHKGISRTVGIHVLIAECFIERVSNKHLVLHKDEKLIDGLLDNSINNLFWGTPSENALDAISKGRAKILSESPNARVVEQIKNGEVVAIFGSLLEAASAVKGSSPSIMRSCKELNRSFKGFTWRYA